MYVQDVAAAFEIILHRGHVGHIYNIGGSNEFSVLEVAKDLMGLFGMKYDDSELQYTEDRAFNDFRFVIDVIFYVHRCYCLYVLLMFLLKNWYTNFRYTIDSSRLQALGWKEKMSWKDGLLTTVKWYKENSHRFGNIEHALNAHPLKMVKKEEDVI